MVLQKISTSLRVEEWERELVGHPDEELVGYVLSGIREGFRVGFDYSKHTCVSARANLLSAGENKLPQRGVYPRKGGTYGCTGIGGGTAHQSFRGYT